MSFCLDMALFVCKADVVSAVTHAVYYEVLSSGGSLAAANTISQSAHKATLALATITRDSESAAQPISVTNGRYFATPAKRALTVVGKFAKSSFNGLNAAANTLLELSADLPASKSRTKARNKCTKMLRYLNQAEALDRHFHEVGMEAWFASLEDTISVLLLSTVQDDGESADLSPSSESSAFVGIQVGEPEAEAAADGQCCHVAPASEVAEAGEVAASLDCECHAFFIGESDAGTQTECFSFEAFTQTSTSENKDDDNLGKYSEPDNVVADHESVVAQIPRINACETTGRDVACKTPPPLQMADVGDPVAPEGVDGGADPVSAPTAAGAVDEWLERFNEPRCWNAVNAAQFLEHLDDIAEKFPRSAAWKSELIQTKVRGLIRCVSSANVQAG